MVLQRIRAREDKVRLTQLEMTQIRVFDHHHRFTFTTVKNSHHTSQLRERADWQIIYSASELVISRCTADILETSHPREDAFFSEGMELLHLQDGKGSHRQRRHICTPSGHPQKRIAEQNRDHHRKCGL